MREMKIRSDHVEDEVETAIKETLAVVDTIIIMSTMSVLMVWLYEQHILATTITTIIIALATAARIHIVEVRHAAGLERAIAPIYAIAQTIVAQIHQIGVVVMAVLPENANIVWVFILRAQ